MSRCFNVVIGIIFLFKCVSSAVANMEARHKGCIVCYQAPASSYVDLTENEADEILEKQRKVQQDIISSCEQTNCFAQIDENQAIGEYDGVSSSSIVLGWAAQQQEVGGGVIEIGASYGGGSTAILARAVKNMSRTVTSIEAVKEKFLIGKNYYSSRAVGVGGGDLPVNLLYGSTISANELPTPSDYRAIHDLRPLLWLEREIELAGTHDFGILGALLKSPKYKDVGMVFVDGGAFTGSAEWVKLEKARHIHFIALDDTHAKTTSILVAASQDPEHWEVVYEELNFRGLEQMKMIGYDLSGGVFSRGHGKKSTWSRHSPSKLGKAADELAGAAAVNSRNGHRNFALLHRL